MLLFIGGPLSPLVVGGGGLSLPFVGAGSGPSSLLVVVVLVGPCCRWWGMVMGCWWALAAVHVAALSWHAVIIACHHCRCCCLSLSPVIVVACRCLHCVLPGLRCVIVGHLVLGLANSKGEGGLTLSLFIVWWPCCRL